VRGWTPAGDEVELTELQERLVRRALDWLAGGQFHLIIPSMPRAGGKSVIMATIAEYDRRWRGDDRKVT
jgi:hypothetical protein